MPLAWSMTIPGGRLPAPRNHEYGGVPPEVTMVAAYVLPTVPLGRYWICWLVRPAE